MKTWASKLRATLHRVQRRYRVFKNFQGTQVDLQNIWNDSAESDPKITGQSGSPDQRRTRPHRGPQRSDQIIYQVIKKFHYFCCCWQLKGCKSLPEPRQPLDRAAQRAQQILLKVLWLMDPGRRTSSHVENITLFIYFDKRVKIILL